MLSDKIENFEEQRSRKSLATASCKWFALRHPRRRQSPFTAKTKNSLVSRLVSSLFRSDLRSPRPASHIVSDLRVIAAFTIWHLNLIIAFAHGARGSHPAIPTRRSVKQARNRHSNPYSSCHVDFCTSASGTLHAKILRVSLQKIVYNERLYFQFILKSVIRIFRKLLFIYF